MYDGIRAYGGIRSPGAAVAILYFITLVIVGNCILVVKYAYKCTFGDVVKNFTRQFSEFQPSCI